MAFLFASIALDIAQVFGFIYFDLNYLDGIELSGWMISSLTFILFFGV